MCIRFSRVNPRILLTRHLSLTGRSPLLQIIFIWLRLEHPNAGPAQLGLKKFFDMMPNLKASDFDYIIFDMPPLDQTSPTWGMAAFMDKLLLVVEAEKNNREVIKRSYGKLIAERNNVAVVVNKARSYVPKWLDGES